MPILRLQSQMPTRLLAPLLALLLTSCDRESAVEKATREGILIMGNSAEPKGLDPHLVSGVLESNIIRALFEGLCVEHPSEEGVATPGAAAEWSHNPEFTEWTFKLQPEGKWSDGTPITSDDFLFAFKRILNPDLGSDYAFMLYYIQDAEAYHRSQRSYLLCREDPAIPDWSTLSKIDFAPNEKAEADSFNAKGLDHLSAGELDRLTADPALFQWPEEIPADVRSLLVEKNLTFAQSGGNIWDLIRFGATAPDPHTLVVKLRAPIPHLLELTKHYTWYPVPKHIVLKHGTADNRFSEWTKPGNLVSNGPFVLKSWRINDHIDVEKNSLYWAADRVKLDGIRYLPIKNLFTEARMFFAGELHVTYSLAPELIDLAKEKYPENFRFDNYLGTRFIRFNVARKPLDDPKVRLALSLAIDREKLIEYVLRGGQSPAQGIVPPLGDYKTSAAVQFDPERARKLLAEAGYPDGKNFPEIRLLTVDSDTSKRSSETYQGMWKEHLNIRVRIDQQEWGGYLNSMFDTQFDLCDSGWIADYLDPNTFLEMWIKDGGNNRTNWWDPEFESLLKRAENTADPSARSRLLEQAEAVFLEQRPVIPIFWYTRNYLIDKRVKGWHPLLLDNHPFRDISLDQTP